MIRFLSLKKIKLQISRKFLSLKSSSGKIKYYKSRGLRIGEDCLYFSNRVPTEPYLVKIGNHVVVSSGVEFITHDGSIWVFRKNNPDIDIFGQISIGNNTFLGIGCILLPNTEIGNNCIIGAGSVIRGKIPDNSVAMGNPAKVIMSTEMMEKLVLNNKNALHTKHMKPEEKTQFVRNHFKLKY